ncbi:MAG TPA: ABC transporter permease [Chitinophagales bacterium]|nr:ABC transporter permease [Chitinophagales bacterium]
MNPLLLRIAFRYLVSKKSTNAINIITAVAMAGMALGSMALILVLSVFNGFEGLVVSLYQAFNPDIIVTVREGKVFTLNDSTIRRISGVNGVENISKVLEENAILKYNDQEYIATIKGVDNHFESVTEVGDKIVEGKFVLSDHGVNYAVVGAGVAAALSVNLENDLSTIQVYLPRRGKETLSLDPSQAFIKKNITPAGVFSIQQEFDSKYIIAPLDFVRELLNYETQMSAIEIKLKPGADAQRVKAQLKQILNDGFLVQDRYEQNKFLYRVMRTEKWAVYAILSLILVIAAFNIIGSLSMLVIEKTRDIAILKTMGADNALIRKIFLLEGLLTSLIGSCIGVILAVVLCLIQIYFKVIKLEGSGTFVIDAYPVEMQAQDFLLVAATVVAIAFATSWLPAQRAASRSAVIIHE